MTDTFKKTTVTKNGDSQTASISTESKVSSLETTQRLIYYFFGFIEVLLAFRLVLKVFGANASSSFVSGIYAVTGVFALPFSGIFRGSYQGGSAFEPGTLIAIAVYALVAWGIVEFLRVLSGVEQTT